MIFYVLNVALILAGCFLFYKVLLQKETFFPLNRIVLLCCLALSFSLPLVPVPAKWSFRKVETPSISTPSFAPTQTISPISTITNTTQSNGISSVPAKSFFKEVSIANVLVWTYWLGVAIFGINFLFQLCVLVYRSYSKPFIQDGRFRIVELSGDQAPCSFANNIFINPDKYDWDTYSQIILHEKIHIQQGHSYDIILAELALIFQWFNPFAWFYRKAVEDNLEFLTDNELLESSDIEPTSYKMSLVKVSAPHFPASLTTNYNQSILKKRLIMMNAKKSNINSTWKYVCLVPLMLVLIATLNEPIAYGHAKSNLPLSLHQSQTAPNHGIWFAAIKNDKISIRFEDENEKGSKNNSEFMLSEFKNLPKNASGDFSLTREAGTVLFHGIFEGSTGTGTYRFNANDRFLAFLENEGIDIVPEKDAMVFYLVNLKRDFVTMLKSQGYTQLSKNELIPLAALNVSPSYINSLKNAGLTKVTLEDLIPLKALNVDAAFVREISNAGYKNLTASKLITLKAQGINGDFIKNARNANETAKVTTYASRTKTKRVNSSTADEEDNDDEMSALGMLIAKKALNISTEVIKGFVQSGFKFTDEELIGMKALGVTPAYCKSFEAIGLSNLKAEDFVGMKSLGITAANYGEYQNLGLKKVTPEDVISAKATGTTAAFIAAMKKKGHHYGTMEKYIEMKVLSLDNQ